MLRNFDHKDVIERISHQQLLHNMSVSGHTGKFMVVVAATGRDVPTICRRSYKLIEHNLLGTVNMLEFCKTHRAGFVLLSTADDLTAVASWPGGRPEMRQVAGRLGDLRDRPVPSSLTTTPRRDTAFYGEYERIHAEHVARDPAHARHTRCEDRDDLRELAEAGLLHDVRVDGTWAGIVAAEPDACRGLRGATVVELLLDHPFRGAGHGAHLSTLLARTLPMPDGQYLLGTIHAENVPAYRAALAAGRVDVGGEVVLPLDHG